MLGQPSSLARAVNSETLSVGAYASIPTIFRKSLTACDAFPALRDHGSTTLDAYSRALDDYGLGDYRRWAFESAALDLALRQNGLTLGAVLGRTYRPVRFVISLKGNNGAMRFELLKAIESEL